MSTEATKLAEEVLDADANATQGVVSVNQAWSVQIKTYGPAPTTGDMLWDDRHAIELCRRAAPKLATALLEAEEELNDAEKTYNDLASTSDGWQQQLAEAQKRIAELEAGDRYQKGWADGHADGLGG